MFASIRLSLRLFIFSIIATAVLIPGPNGLNHAFSTQVWETNPQAAFTLPPQLKKRLAGYRSTWKQLTGLEFSGLHWKNRVIIYSNQGAQTFRQNFLHLQAERNEVEEQSLPPYQAYELGTIFIKEGYKKTSTGLQAIQLNVMIKREPGYDPEGGDWQYLQYTPLGKTIVQGSNQDPKAHQACGACHQNIAERDFIFATIYRSPSVKNHAWP